MGPSSNASRNTLDDQASNGGFRLTLEVWHPDCWTLEVTGETDASLVAHTVYNAEGHKVKGHFTVCGDTLESVEALVDATSASNLTESVTEMQRRHAFEHQGTMSGKSTKELFVKYDSRNTISDAFLDGDFYQEAPVRVQNGREYWPLFFDEDRELLSERLEEIRAEYDAEIEVKKLHSNGTGSNDVSQRIDSLSGRQREIFELACEHGYYSWPREVTTRELAEAAGIAKTTLLEHLRKAESKLLNPDNGF